MWEAFAVLGALGLGAFLAWPTPVVRVRPRVRPIASHALVRVLRKEN